MVLLTLTGIVGYFIPDPSLKDINWIDIFILVLIGYFSAGGSMVINNYIDRDIDILMERTKNRPSVGPNAINPPEKILVFGSILVASSLIIGYIRFNLLTALFLAWGSFFYLFGYSLYIKRKSVLNTILGGFASPTPVWVGYAARTGEINLEAWLLGALVFIWTPSHTWALSTKHIDDYTAAKIPMLPVKLGMEKTAKITFGFGLGVMFYGSWMAYWFSNTLWIFGATLIPNAILFYGLWVFLKKPSKKTANKCFKMHNTYLTIIFAIVLIYIWS